MTHDVWYVPESYALRHPGRASQAVTERLCMLVGIMSNDVLLATVRATTWRTELRSWTGMLARLGLSAKYSVYAVHQPKVRLEHLHEPDYGRPVNQHGLYLKLVS